MGAAIWQDVYKYPPPGGARLSARRFFEDTPIVTGT